MATRTTRFADHVRTGLLDRTDALVHGSTVVVVSDDGRIEPGGHLGVYHRDVRLVSRMAVTVDGAVPPLLAAARTSARSAQHVWAVDTDHAGVPTALLVRTRTVDHAGVMDAYELRAFARPVRRAVEVEVEVDFAILRKGVGAEMPEPWRRADGGVVADRDRAGVRLTGEGTEFTLDAAETRSARIIFPAVAAPGQPWTGSLRVTATWDGAPPARPPGGSPHVLAVTADDPRWSQAVASAADDLAALRLRDDASGGAFTAAGAPWYLALFGRDSLLTAMNAVIADVEGAVATLEVLAHHQGRTHVPHRLEQPGRIVHELRSGGMEVFTAASGEPYYGTADAPALFVILLAEAHRWGASPDRVARLLPAARAAVTWCLSDGDLDGDGWIEYGGHEGGLANQGWKDSGDAMVHADGRQAEGPIALCEVQAYLIRALEDLAALEEVVGRAGEAAALRAEATSRRQAFRRDFWLPDQGVIAMALDGDKRPLAVASSNMGHCLWAGAVDGDVAAAVADRLVRPDLLGDWGVRTLAASEQAYNPLGYHLGSIWPHDAALVAAGLQRYGHDVAAAAVIDRLLRVAALDGGRLPEIYGGLDAAEAAAVVAYPTACSPQAWSASAPLLLLRTVLGLDPDVPAGTVRLRPLQHPLTPSVVKGVGLGSRVVRIDVRGEGPSVRPCDGRGPLPWAVQVG